MNQLQQKQLLTNLKNDEISAELKVGRIENRVISLEAPVARGTLIVAVLPDWNTFEYWDGMTINDLLTEERIEVSLLKQCGDVESIQTTSKSKYRKF